MPSRSRAESVAPAPPPAPIRLVPDQTAHCERVRGVLRRSPFALDFSGLGCGKTYTASALALDPALGVRHVVLVAPLSVISKWRDVQRRHGVPLTRALTYCQLRGVEGKQPKHGLLNRVEDKGEDDEGAGGGSGSGSGSGKDDEGKKKASWEFRATALFRGMVRDEGVLLVIDEMQNIKNANTQTAACRELVREVCDDFEARGGDVARSRVLLMSGTPFDDAEQVLRLLRTVRVLRGPLCTGGAPPLWRGMHDVVGLCASVDAAATARILGRCGPHSGYHSGYLQRICYQLFRDVLVPGLASEMPTPRLRARVHKANAFFDIDPESRDALARSVGQLERAALYDPARCTATRLLGPQSVEQLRNIAEAIEGIEAAKLGTMALIAAAKLEAFPNVHVVLCVNYTRSIVLLRGALERFRPLVLHGETSGAQRARALALFHAPDSGHRLLIANLRTCSTGIDLDDKHGEYPRYCLASPTYSVIDVHQLGHRFLRMDTRSDAVLHLMYGRNACELPVLSVLAQKSGVMREMTRAQVEGGVLFPGDYPEYDVRDNTELLRDRCWSRINWSDPSHALVLDFVPFLRARHVIGRAMARAYLDTRYAWCRRRLQREFEALRAADEADC